MTLVVTVIFTTEVSSFDIPSNSCYLALHKYLADITPIFNTTDKSLAFEIGKPTLDDVKVNPIVFTDFFAVLCTSPMKMR